MLRLNRPAPGGLDESIPERGGEMNTPSQVGVQRGLGTWVLLVLAVFSACATGRPPRASRVCEEAPTGAYAVADVRIDRELDDIPWDRCAEIERMFAMEERRPPREP